MVDSLRDVGVSPCLARIDVSEAGVVLVPCCPHPHPLLLNNSARLIIPIQNEENKELWHDLQTGETPPEAAVGNEGQAQAPRKWEKVTDLIDCEKGLSYSEGEVRQRPFPPSLGSPFYPGQTRFILLTKFGACGE